MIFSKRLRVTCATAMAVVLTNIPYIACAETAATLTAPPTSDKMIPTAIVVDEMSRTQAREKIESYISRAEVRSELIKRGVSPDEVSSRLANLSDVEMKQMARQMDQAMYGGDSVVGILVVVLLVLLIIYLAKRI